MGEIDQDIPVWKSTLDAQDEVRIEKSDKELVERHIDMVERFADLVFGVASNEVDYWKYDPDGENEIKKEDEVKTKAVVSSKVEDEERRLLELAISESLGEQTKEPVGHTGRSFQLPPFACFQIIGAASALGAVIDAMTRMPEGKRKRVKSLNLEGCISLKEEEFMKLIKAFDNLMNLRCAGLTCLGADGCIAIGTRRRLRYLDLSNTDMNDEKVAALTNSAKDNGARIKKFSIANAGGITDEGIKVSGSEARSDEQFKLLQELRSVMCLSLRSTAVYFHS